MVAGISVVILIAALLIGIPLPFAFACAFMMLTVGYGYDINYIPMKGYGMLESTFLRLYAIRFKENCYLIVCGGIKLNDTIQNSPVLQEIVFNKIDKVKQYLTDECILDIDDI